MVKLTKSQMLERLQFSKNLQVAIRCARLLTNEISENEIFGSFLTAVLKNDCADAWMRADDHNKAALMAKSCTIGTFRYTKPDKDGYISGKAYYLRLTTVSGGVQITPTATSEGTELTYPNLKEFLFSWQLSVWVY